MDAHSQVIRRFVDGRKIPAVPRSVGENAKPVGIDTLGSAHRIAETIVTVKRLDRIPAIAILTEKLIPR